MRRTFTASAFIGILLFVASPLFAQPVDDGYVDDFYGDDFGQPDPAPYTPTGTPDTKPYVADVPGEKPAPVDDYAPPPPTRTASRGASKFGKPGTKLFFGSFFGSYVKSDYSSTAEDSDDPYETQNTDLTFHAAPSFGFFVANGFAVSIGPSYSFSKDKSSGGFSDDSEDTSKSHTLGVRGGLGLYIPMQSGMFFNLGAAATASYGITDYEDKGGSSTWSGEIKTVHLSLLAGPGLTWVFGKQKGGFFDLNLYGQYRLMFGKAESGGDSEWSTKNKSDLDQKTIAVGLGATFGTFF